MSLSKSLYRIIIRAIAKAQVALTPGFKCAILYYHSIGGDALSAPTRVFESTIKTLTENGYQGVSINQLGSAIREGKGLSGKVCVINFDDCFESAYTEAFPILLKYKFPATFFIATEYVGGVDQGDYNGTHIQRPYIKWNQISELVKHGMEIGAHTCSHPNLPEVPLEQAREEIVKSKETLQERLGTPIEVFAYPRGRLNDSVVKLVQETGFQAAVSTSVGTNTPRINPFRLKRHGGGLPTQGDTLLDLASGVLAAQTSIHNSKAVEFLRRVYG